MKKLTMRGIVIPIGGAIGVIALLALLVSTMLAGHSGVHAASGSTSPSLFALEHQHGKSVKNTPGSSGTFSYNCSAQGGVKGNLIINVTENVINDADSGQAGDYWAFDTYTRTIKVWNVGADSYCAIVAYPTATFAAIAGQQSPGSTGGNGGILTGDEVGKFAGSSQFLITGQLDLSNPTTWPVTGNVNGGNVVDYQCDSTGNCPGYVNWMAQYFASSGLSYTEPQWGWKYTGHDGPNAPDKGTADGVWVNAATGDSGDILDVD